MRGSPRAHCGAENPRGRATWDHGRVTNTPRTRVSDRFNAITPSATLAVDAKAKALKAAGRPVIGFGAGEPDFATPDYIVEAAVKAAAVRRARETWYLVDDSKFGRVYPAVIGEIYSGAILTNRCPDPKYRQLTLVKETEL